MGHKIRTTLYTSFLSSHCSPRSSSRGWCAIPLSPVLEPIGHLCHGETGLVGQGSLLIRGRVSVVFVHFLEGVTRLLFEAIHRVLTIPNGPREGEFATQPILIHCTCNEGKRIGSVQIGIVCLFLKIRVL